LTAAPQLYESHISLEGLPFVSYKNIVDRFFVLVTKHMSNRQTDEQNYDCQDRASIARTVKKKQR